MTHQLIVAGPPGYLALAALFIRYFAILALGQRAQIWLDVGPDHGPHSGHSGRSPATFGPDTLDPGEVLDLAHEHLHLRAGPPFIVKVGEKGGRNLSKLRDVLVRGTHQPEVDQLDQGETRRVPPRRRKRVKLAMVEPDLEVAA